MLETDGPYQGKPYRGWMENGCSLLGTDTRIAERAAAGASLKAAQKLYATWSNDMTGPMSNTVRITWSGADWKRDGDLFVYLDTVSDDMPGASYTRHGSNVAYDPYSATMSSTLMLLPLSEYSTGAPSNFPDAARFNADWLLWVEDNDTVHLLRWSDANQTWEEQELPAGSFNFDDSGDEPLTEFSLPRALLNFNSDAMRIVAFATEDGALRTWSVLPAANPVTSGRVVAGAPAPGEPLQIMMSDSYYVQLTDGNCRTPEARMLFDLSAEPGGLVLASKDDEMRLIVPPLTVRPNAFAKIFKGYHDFAGNLESEIGAAHRSWLSGTYCPANAYDLVCLPADQSVSAAERLSKVRDVEYPALLIGQRVTYTVRYVNESERARPYSIFLQSQGTSGLGTVQWDAREWTYGCPNWVDAALPAQSAGELTFTGVVIRPTSRVTVEVGGSEIAGAYVQPGCGVVPAMVINPYNQLAAYYDEDRAAPRYVSIDAPESQISPGLSLFYGAVVDKSPVPTVTLEYVVGTGGTNSVVCGGDSEPSDGVWACVINVGAAADGVDVKVRVRATDAFGNVSAFSAWKNYKVDAAEPVLTPQSQTQTSGGSGSGLTIGGVVTDNGSISGIQVCNRTTGVCTNITIVFTTSEVQQTNYVIEAADVAPEPLGRGLSVMSAPTAASICGVGSTGVVRSFVVSDTFTVADVTVNLNVAHPKRSDVRVVLVSPLGTTAKLIDFTTVVRTANFDVVLTDAAAMGVTEDSAAQDVGAPNYENARQPVEALSVFDGEEAVGEWVLAVCDAQADADSGVLNSAQLQLQAERTATSTTGTWTFDVAAEGDVDGEDRTFEFYAVDASGNRSSVPTVVTVTLDNVAPVLTVTQAAALIDVSVLTPTVVLTGSVRDGGGVQSVQVRVEGPSGATTIDAVRVAAGSAPLGAARTTTEWEYEFVPSEVGRHKVTLTAADAKGNTTTSAEYVVYAEESVIGLGLSVDATAGLINEMRQFVAATTGGSNVEYTWDFGDGEIVTGSGGVVQHAYGAAGIYAVVVTASNALGSLSAGVTMNVSEVLVEPTPTATPSGPTPTPPGFEPTPGGPTATPTPSGPTPTPGVLRAAAYLPLLMRDAVLGVDLVVASLQVAPATGLAAMAPAEIAVVVKNESRVAVSEFWVDLYVDPTRAPRVNEQWSTLCEPAWPNANCYGGAWHVTQELAAGETMTLTSQSLIGDAAYSHWTGTFAQAGERRIYVLVDSYSESGSLQGVVSEEDEMNNGANMTVTVTAGTMVQLEGAPVEELGPLQER
jgi:subtilisin-like proprotein convertase family protein